jgi:hypothetical protein
MSFLDKINKGVDKLGQVSESLSKKSEELTKKPFERYLMPNEVIEHVVGAKWGAVVLTNLRVIFSDRSLISTKSTVSSIGYSKISYVSIQDDGLMSWGKDVIITVGSRNVDIEMNNSTNAIELFMEINKRIL